MAASKQDRIQQEMTRADIRALRRKLQELRKLRASAVAKARAHCRASRRRASARAKSVYDAAVAEARRKGAELRAEARRACERKTRKARASSKDEETRLKRELAAKRQYDRFIRGVDQRVESATRARVAQQESDDEVRANIDRELWPVFAAVKKQIRKKPGASRTEVFLEWVEEHPDDVWQYLDAAGAKRFETDLAEQRKEFERVERILRKSVLTQADWDALQLDPEELARAGFDPRKSDDVRAWLSGEEAVPF